MANSIDNAITNLQVIVRACTDAVIKSAPDYPIENADPFPFSAAYLADGNFTFTNATIHHHFPQIRLEIHFSRVHLKTAYQQINAIALELPRRLASDPTLGGTVETIVATRDNPIEYTVRPFEWGKVQSELLQFVIPIKLLKSPI